MDTDFSGFSTDSFSGKRLELVVSGIEPAFSGMGIVLAFSGREEELDCSGSGVELASSGKGIKAADCNGWLTARTISDSCCLVGCSPCASGFDSGADV